MKHHSFLLFTLLFLLAACSTSTTVGPQPQEEPITDISGLDVPDDFDYATTRSINLSVSAKGDIGQALEFALVSVSAESGDLLKAVTNAEGSLETVLTLPSYLSSLEISLTHPDFKETKTIGLTSSSELSVVFDPNAANLMSAAGSIPFTTCPTLGFLFQNGTTDAYGVNLASGATPMLSENLSDPDSGLKKINAIGFNILDNYIYGHLNGDKNGTIARVGLDYGVTVLGPIAGLEGFGFYVGDVSADGHLYLTTANNSKFYIVDVDASSDTYLELIAVRDFSRRIQIYDWAFNPLDNMIYAVQTDNNGSHLFRVNPASGAVEDLGATGIPKGTYGAGYYDASGYYYVSSNNTGFIYRMDTTNPAGLSAQNPINSSTQVSTFSTNGPKSSSNDGARCMNAASPTEADDNDGDGVPDSTDEYPLNPDYAFNNVSTGSLAFEDRWPLEDDYDFNDVVIDYSINQITNASNNVATIVADYTFKAAGAAYTNAFAIELPFAPSVVKSITGANVNYQGEWSYLNFNENKTEANQTNAVVFISDDIGRTLGYLVNTDPNGKSKDPVTVSVNIDLVTPQPLAGLSVPYNPFLVANVSDISLAGFSTPRVRGTEIHLANHAPTDLADLSLFGTGDDDSDVNADRYYLNSSNLPWAMHIPETFEYPVERAQVLTAHKKFSIWANTSGASYGDWYQNKSSYRNTQFIY